VSRGAPTTPQGSPACPSLIERLSRPRRRLNHTCYRISDPAVSLPFYRDGLGLRLFFVFNTGLFTIYYLGYPKGGETIEVAEVRGMQQREGLLEL